MFKWAVKYSFYPRSYYYLVCKYRAKKINKIKNIVADVFSIEEYNKNVTKIYI